MPKLSVFVLISFFSFLSHGTAVASEKDKHFATQCYYVAKHHILSSEEYKGTELETAFVYFPIIIESLQFGEITLPQKPLMKIEMSVVYAWGERKKVEAECEHYESGAVYSSRLK